MVDISQIRSTTGTIHTITDYRIPQLNNSENMYLRGDGSWEVPAALSSSGTVFVDGGDCLIIKIEAN